MFWLELQCFRESKLCCFIYSYLPLCSCVNQDRMDYAARIIKSLNLSGLIKQNFISGHTNSNAGQPLCRLEMLPVANPLPRLPKSSSFALSTGASVDCRRDIYCSTIIHVLPQISRPLGVRWRCKTNSGQRALSWSDVSHFWVKD